MKDRMRFIFVDRIIKMEREKVASGIKNLAMSEDYFEHHFPFFPVMPGVLMLETMVQLSSWLISYSTEFNFFGLLSKLYDAKFRRSVQPGDSLEIQVDWIERTNTGIVFRGRVLRGADMIAEARFENKLIGTEQNEEKASLEKLYHFLTTRFGGD